MAKQSAGLILYRIRNGELQVFLVHSGGPFWAKKDLGAWSIPKGEYSSEEDQLVAARRELQEETGFAAEGDFLDLGSIRQSGGKIVTAWALEGDCNPADLQSNVCEVEWPPRSGRTLEIPEVDRGEWFLLSDAEQRILAAQKPLLQRLRDNLPGGEPTRGSHSS